MRLMSLAETRRMSVLRRLGGPHSHGRLTQPQACSQLKRTPLVSRYRGDIAAVHPGLSSAKGTSASSVKKPSIAPLRTSSDWTYAVAVAQSGLTASARSSLRSRASVGTRV